MLEKTQWGMFCTSYRVYIFLLRLEFFSNTRNLKLFPKYYITYRCKFIKPPKKFNYKKITLFPSWSIIKLGSTEHDIKIPTTEISWKISEKSGNKPVAFFDKFCASGGRTNLCLLSMLIDWRCTSSEFNLSK